MNTDQKTTIWGAVSAACIAGFTFIQTGHDVMSPAFWAGLVGAVAMALHGFYSNK